jgi:hypothetical protein
VPLPAEVTDGLLLQDLHQIQQAALTLLGYCQARDWAGYDPYDGLNSRLFEAVPLLNFKWARLALLQCLKRCPINLRPLLLVPRRQNPKALALFLSASLKLSRLGLLREPGLAQRLADVLAASRSPNSAYWCWGYSFPWQTRTVLVPRGAPNLVCTSFVANALLDLYEATGEPRLMAMAASAADYLLNELYWTNGDSLAGFGYPIESLRSQVHNANFLGAALLCRVARLCAKPHYLNPALRVARHSASRQRMDGSWDYGEGSAQGWIDNFHTGYNLCALRRIGEDAETSEFEPQVARGFEFYRNHFFRPDGEPRYFHNRTHPLDIHCAAQSIITLLELKHLHPDNQSLAHLVLRWTFTNLRAPAGFFYYQKSAWGTTRIPYIRWGQAWMLLALASLLSDCRGLADVTNERAPLAVLNPAR